MAFPNFFIVGAPKAGTTTLYHHLRAHPDVFMSEAKEPHYFSYAGEGQPRWGVQTLDAYRTLFDGVQNETAVGEASTWYLYSETAAEQIQRAVPDAGIIALLRDPVSRAYSSWSYRVQMGWESEPFERAIVLEEQRRAAGEPWDVHYLNAGWYADQVDRYLRAFGPDQVRVFLFEDLTSDPAAVVSEALRFVGVDPNATTVQANRVHNATVMPRWTALTRFLKRGDVRSLARRVPAPLRRVLADSLRSVNRRNRPRLDPGLRQSLQDRFRPDVRRLEILLGKDLERCWFGGNQESKTVPAT